MGRGVALLAALSLAISLSVSVQSASAATPKPPPPSSTGAQSSDPSVEHHPGGPRQTNPPTSPRQLRPSLTTAGSWSSQNPSPDCKPLFAADGPVSPTC